MVPDWQILPAESAPRARPRLRGVGMYLHRIGPQFVVFELGERGLQCFARQVARGDWLGFDGRARVRKEVLVGFRRDCVTVAGGDSSFIPPVCGRFVSSFRRRLPCTAGPVPG